MLRKTYFFPFHTSKYIFIFQTALFRLHLNGVTHVPLFLILLAEFSSLFIALRNYIALSKYNLIHNYHDMFLLANSQNIRVRYISVLLMYRIRGATTSSVCVNLVDRSRRSVQRSARGSTRGSTRGSAR